MKIMQRRSGCEEDQDGKNTVQHFGLQGVSAQSERNGAESPPRPRLTGAGAGARACCYRVTALRPGDESASLGIRLQHIGE
jgi:hypothetical protein